MAANPAETAGQDTPLTGDSILPEIVIDRRRQILADVREGLLPESEGETMLSDLESRNPTATKAYEQNLRHLGDVGLNQ